MADDKPTPPDWLNPGAILGAVELIDPHLSARPEGYGGWVYAFDHDPERRSASLVPVDFVPFGEEMPRWDSYFHRNVKLRPDLWPVKPELAAMFGEATNAT